MAWSPKRIGIFQRRLRGWFHDSTRYPDPVSSLVLSHVDASTGASTRTVGRWSAPWPDGGADVIAQECQLRIEEDADTWGGTQRYVLTAYFGGGTGVSEGLTLSQSGNTTDEDRDLSAAPSEKPNSAGLMAQLMRHTEVSQRQNAIATAAVLDRLVEENRRLSARAEADDARKIGFINAYETLMNNATKRRIEEEAAKQTLEIKKEVMGYVKVLVPIIANYVASGKALPEVMTPEQMAMAAFFDSLEPETWQAVQAALPGPQQMFVNHLLSLHLDAKEKREGTYQGDRPMGAIPANVDPNVAPLGTGMTVEPPRRMGPAPNGNGQAS